VVAFGKNSLFPDLLVPADVGSVGFDTPSERVEVSKFKVFKIKYKHLKYRNI